MKVKSITENNAAPLSRGRFYVRDTRKWGLIAQKWPKKRPKKTTPAEKYKQEEFGLAAKWASSPEPMAYATAVEMVKGTEYVPRDFLMAGMFGVAYQIEEPNGHVWEVERLVSTNPQYIFDLLNPVNSGIPYRHVDGWRADVPAIENKFLTWENGKPAWRTPMSGGGGGGYELVHDQVVSAPTPSIAVDIEGAAKVYWLFAGANTQSNSFIDWHVSTDGGLTYFDASGNYTEFTTTGVSTAMANATTHNTASINNRQLWGELTGTRFENGPRIFESTASGTRRFVANDLPITHLRVRGRSFPLTAGRYRVWRA